MLDDNGDHLSKVSCRHLKLAFISMYALSRREAMLEMMCYKLSKIFCVQAGGRWQME